MTLPALQVVPKRNEHGVEGTGALLLKVDFFPCEKHLLELRKVIITRGPEGRRSVPAEHVQPDQT